MAPAREVLSTLGGDGPAMRTVGVVYDPALDVWDLDGTVPDALEALRQRIIQAIWLQVGEWFIRRNAGLDRSIILGHRINAALAAQALNEVVRREGGAEITGLRDTFFEVERSTRTLRYRVVADTIYGELRMEGTA